MKFAQGELVVFRDAKSYQAAQAKLLTYQGHAHPGWKDPGHMFFVLRERPGGIVLVPVSSDPVTGAGLPTPSILAVDEADVVEHATYLHVGLTTIAKAADLKCRKQHPSRKGRCAAFHGKRLAALVSRIEQFWPPLRDRPR
jgi:hypothetical protein